MHGDNAPEAKKAERCTVGHNREAPEQLRREDASDPQHPQNFCSRSRELCQLYLHSVMTVLSATAALSPAIHRVKHRSVQRSIRAYLGPLDRLDYATHV